MISPVSLKPKPVLHLVFIKGSDGVVSQSAPTTYAEAFQKVSRAIEKGDSATLFPVGVNIREVGKYFRNARKRLEALKPQASA